MAPPIRVSWYNRDLLSRSVRGSAWLCGVFNALWLLPRMKPLTSLDVSVGRKQLLVYTCACGVSQAVACVVEQRETMLFNDTKVHRQSI